MADETGTADSAPLADILGEAARVSARAEADGVLLRALGGVAIALRCPSAHEAPLHREYADIDLAGRAADRKAITRLLIDLGYAADEQFNAVHGATRLFFWDERNARQVDVFLDRFEMCHRIEFGDRLGIDRQTLPLAELLLMKLQVVETNEKDLTDILALLVDQPFTDDDTGIGIRRLQQLTGSDWGLWKTTLTVIEHADAHARRLEGFTRAADVHHKTQAYLAALEAAPKTSGWKLRARVGTRVRWYELPEESH
jgi:hypothetical protein